MAEARCSACGTANDPRAKFCGECGTSLAATCPQCGAPAAGGRFCTECGAPLSAAPADLPAARQVEPVAERRIASLLFADLVGFTPISETRDPEAVRELLSAYFTRAREVVERYGGTVEKFIGDAVCAVWGVPAAREDDAERAVRAGLDLVSAVAALGADLGVDDLQMRVGVTTGQVAVTLGAVGEGMVAGDAVNTAARVQAVAGEGEVWVDDTTRSLTTAGLAYEPMGRHELKGKAVPLELFRAVRTTAALGGQQRVDGLEAPFVGRDRELRLVKELFHATAEEGRARLVLVAGEPGIGKSRLAWEFEKYLDAITSHMSYWLRGRCLSYGQGVAGRVVAEMLRSLLRVTDTDDEETVRRALDERLARHVPDPEEREVLRPRLESVLGLTDRTFDQADLFACWRAFLEALTSTGDVVTLVAEDLQWADDSFLDFIDHLLDAARGPVIVLALARPEITSRRPGIGAGRRATTVFLEPLADGAMRSLLDGLVANLPVTLRDELVRRAEGVPLYAVETVRSLIDRDVVVPVEGRYVVDPDAAAALDLGNLALPASLQALLAARLDALSPDERRVVQDASVLGLTCTRTAIEALSPPGIDLDAVLDGLRAKEILTVDADPRSPERGQLRFVQALLRGVAYETLSRRDRKARHIAAAGILAGLPEADSIAAVLATHYLDAAAAVPEDADAEALRSLAAEHLERAAEHAVDVGAPVDALGHYAQLLALTPPDEVLVRVTLRAADLMRGIGTRLDEVLHWIEAALPVAARIGAEDDVLALRLSRSVLRSRRTERLGEAREDAQTVFDASIGVPGRVHLVAGAARSLCLIAQVLGEVDLAQEVTVRALADVERFGDDADFSAFLDTMSMWFGVAGYRRLAGLVRRASADQHGPRDPAAVASLANLAAAVMHDDIAEAARAATASVDLARALGMNDVAASGHLVVAGFAAGRWGEAIEILRRHPEEEASELVDWECYLAAGAALLAWGTGDPTLLRRPVVGADRTPDPVVRGWSLMRDAVEAAFGGDLGAAARTAARGFDQMLELGPAHEDIPLAYCLAVDLLLAVADHATLERITAPLEQLARGQRYQLVQGQLLRARGHLDGDRPAALRRAAEVFEAMGAAYWAARARAELAEALAATGEPAAARRAAEDAEPLLRTIGAEPALTRLVPLLASGPAAAVAPG